MIDSDNTFSGIFGNVPSIPRKTDSTAQQEDTSSIVEPPASELHDAAVQQRVLEDNSPDATEKHVRKRGRRRKGDVNTDGSTPDKVGHFSCICDKDLIAKVRAIAWQEHMTVRAVVESMFSKCIAKYEKKRGPIQIEPNQSSEELF